MKIGKGQPMLCPKCGNVTSEVNDLSISSEIICCGVLYTFVTILTYVDRCVGSGGCSQVSNRILIL